MDKKDLMWSLSWQHPTSSLEIDMVRANVGRVAKEEMMQQEVIDCLQEAPRLAAGVKREAQRLIGHFIETLRNRMDQAEEDKRREMLLKEPLETMSEADRLQTRKGAVAEAERNILSSFCDQVKPNEADEGGDDAGDDKENDDPMLKAGRTRHTKSYTHS